MDVSLDTLSLMENVKFLKFPTASQSTVKLALVVCSDIIGTMGYHYQECANHILSIVSISILWVIVSLAASDQRLLEVSVRGTLE